MIGWKMPSFVQAPSALLVLLVQISDILELEEIIPGHVLTCIHLCPPNFFMIFINLLHGVP